MSWPYDFAGKSVLADQVVGVGFSSARWIRIALERELLCSESDRRVDVILQFPTIFRELQRHDELSTAADEGLSCLIGL